MKHFCLQTSTNDAFFAYKLTFTSEIVIYLELVW